MKQRVYRTDVEGTRTTTLRQVTAVPPRSDLLQVRS